MDRVLRFKNIHKAALSCLGFPVSMNCPVWFSSQVTKPLSCKEGSWHVWGASLPSCSLILDPFRPNLGALSHFESFVSGVSVFLYQQCGRERIRWPTNHVCYFRCLGAIRFCSGMLYPFCFASSFEIKIYSFIERWSSSFV